MVRRKGERTNRHRDRTHPFQVAHAQTAGPAAYEIMYRWAAWFDFETRSNGLRGMCWCFCRSEVADAFAMDFGGERIDRPVDPHCLRIDQPDAGEIDRRASASLLGIERVTGGREPDTRSLLRGAARMPFSSFSDPADVARAQGALDRAWAIVKASVDEADHERARLRLAYVVASYAMVCADEDELAARAVERFRDPNARPAR